MGSGKKLLGIRIKSLREAKDLTQERLAERMDINSKYLSSIERGKENPTLDMLLNFADALDVEMWELFDFGHETSLEELKRTMNKFLKEMDEEKLKLAFKVFRSVMR